LFIGIEVAESLSNRTKTFTFSLEALVNHGKDIKNKILSGIELSQMIKYCPDSLPLYVVLAHLIVSKATLGHFMTRKLRGLWKR